MNKALMEQLELEKRKREILKEAQNNKKGDQSEFRRGENTFPYVPERKSDYDDVTNQDSSQKFAWEYELERYRKDKLKARFHLLGSICGILALVLTLYFNASQWLTWF